MKILLLGEYSNVHWTLAEGLRTLGQEVVVVSDGDAWKNYPRDVDLRRRSLRPWDTLRYLWDVHRLMPRLKGYDVVQLINPVFLDLRAERMWKYYYQLRRQNGKVILGAFGMDYYWVRAGVDCHTFRYSDFNLGPAERHSAWNDQMKSEWLHGEKGWLNRFIADDCAGIVSGLYEYDVCYRPYFAEKLRFIPFPIKPDQSVRVSNNVAQKVRFFIGIQRGRSAYKGTDIMLSALERLASDYPDRVEVCRAESVPFSEYRHMMLGCDVLLDQLYSYTPAMNGLHAMSQGLVLVGGGEPEQYEILGEKELRPIVNVLPDEQDVYRKLEQLVLHPEWIPALKHQSLEYIRRHHDYRKVARQYLEFYEER
ncbi:MAG: glycosyltransferase [Bacteroidaceae bacterium]|nr:glycosyltransferase [Bacteroidaceae bacterium]